MTRPASRPRPALAVALAGLLGGCVGPRPLGLARVGVCLSYETAPYRADARPRPVRGASACADFEPAPAEVAE